MKGLGIEAKTRILDDKIKAADEAIDRLKSLASMVGASILDFLPRIGRFDSALTTEELIEYAERTRALLERLEVSKQDIASIVRPWASAMCEDLRRSILMPVHEKAIALSKTTDANLKHLQTTNPNDPTIPALQGKVHEWSAYTTLLFPAIQNLPVLADYPECIFRVLELEAPDPAMHSIVAEATEKARPFSKRIRELRDKGVLSEKELWISQISG